MCGKLTDEQVEEMGLLEMEIRNYLGPQITEHRVKEDYEDHVQWFHKDEETGKKITALWYRGTDYVRLFFPWGQAHLDAKVPMSLIHKISRGKR